MPEVVLEVQVTVTVDTNKRTITKTYQSLKNAEQALARVRRAVNVPDALTLLEQEEDDG